MRAARRAENYGHVPYCHRTKPLPVVVATVPNNSFPKDGQDDSSVLEGLKAVRSAVETIPRPD
jgi:hypothetical protein